LADEAVALAATGEILTADGRPRTAGGIFGRPGRVVEKRDLVITMMTKIEAPKAFPKGVPTPPATPTVYTIYIAV